MSSKRKGVKSQVLSSTPRAGAAKKMSPAESSDWREQPWLIALGSGAAVAVFFFTVISPILTATYQNKIEKLEEKLSESSNPRTGLKATRAELSLVKGRLSKAEDEIARLRMEDPFKDGDPYPLGIRLVRLGQSIKEVAQLYVELNPKEKESWVEVDPPSSLFGDVVFYKSKDSEDPVVSRILIHTMSEGKTVLPGGSEIPRIKNNHEAIDRFLTEQFGAADKVVKINGDVSAKCWLDRRGADIELDIISLTLTPSNQVVRGCGIFDKAK